MASYATPELDYTVCMKKKIYNILRGKKQIRK